MIFGELSEEAGINVVNDNPATGNQLSGNSNGGMNVKALRFLLSSKVDKDEYENLISTKANKSDIYSSFKNIEVIHSQLSNITIMLVEFLRLLGLGPGDVEKYETEKFWQQKRIYLNQ